MTSKMNKYPNNIDQHLPMKRSNIHTIILLAIFSFYASLAMAQKTLPHIKNSAYRCGEKLTFRVHYGVIDAGECSLEIKAPFEKVGPRDVYHVVGIGKSLGAFNWFFKVDDRYETFLDADAISPWVFIRRVNEGGYKITQDYSFNPYKNTVSTGKEVKEVPDNIQDLLSSFYYARTLDYNNLKEGDVLTIEIFLDNKIYPMGIKYLGKQTIETKLGTFPCMKFSPQLQKGRIFKDQEGMTLWISDDLNHLPIRVESELLIGSIKIDLSSYSGLANIINKTQ